MKQRSVRVYAVEIVIRQIKLQEILLPYFAATMGAHHLDEMFGAFQTYCDVTEFSKYLEVAAGPTAKIYYRIRRFALDGLQQGSNVLADVVIARAFPEIFGVLVVVSQREVSDLFQVSRLQSHIQSISHAR